MPLFSTDDTLRTPFGKNVYLRSVKDIKPESYTFAASGIPAETIDGATQKVLQPGTVIAKITSGDDAGKVGVFDRGTRTGAVNEHVVITRTATGGTVDITLDGATALNKAVVAATTAANILSYLEGLPNVNPGDVTVTGSAGGPFTVTFVAGAYAGANAPNLTIDQTNATGGTVVAVVTDGSAASYANPATDGRASVDNIVGINDTFLPWQLLHGDREIAVVYEAAVVQGWCFEYVAGVRTALTNTTRDAIVGLPNLALLFK